MGFLGSLIGGTAGWFLGGPMGAAAGAAMGGGYDAYQNQQETNQTNVALAHDQMAFQERMRSTAWQTAVDDMKKAGLNPVLAYGQGPAPSPPGALAHVDNAVAPGMSSAAQAAQTVASFQAILRNQAELEKVEADTNLVKAQTQSPEYYGFLANSQLDLLHEQSNRETASAKLGYAQALTEEEKQKVAALQALLDKDSFSADSARRQIAAKLDQLEIPKSELTNKILGLEVPRSEAEAKFYEGLGKANPYVRMLVELLRGGGSAASIGKAILGSRSIMNKTIDQTVNKTIRITP